MKRCTIVIADAGPFNSLWVADKLALLLALEMRIIVPDAVFDEMTSDLSFPKDRDVLDFIRENQPPFTLARTDIGVAERSKREMGGKLKRNAGELSIVDFMSSEDGLRTYLGPGDPVAILFEDSGLRVFSMPPNLHLLSTVGMLRGLERVGVIRSADDIIHAMTHPAILNRRPADRRVFTDLPQGVDEPAVIGSSWEPPKPV